MMPHERVDSILKLTRMIGWAMFLLLAVSHFDLTLLSKHSQSEGKHPIRHTALEPALPEDSSDEIKIG